MHISYSLEVLLIKMIIHNWNALNHDIAHEIHLIEEASMIVIVRLSSRCLLQGGNNCLSPSQELSIMQVCFLGLPELPTIHEGVSCNRDPSVHCVWPITLLASSSWCVEVYDLYWHGNLGCEQLPAWRKSTTIPNCSRLASSGTPDLVVATNSPAKWLDW